MKRIGILGGVSAESTVLYYRTITREVVRRTGRADYPEIIIYSVSFGDFARLQHAGEWDLITARMVAVFQALHRAGAQLGLIAANTLHAVFPEVARRSPIPLLSIVEATACEAKRLGLERVGLLGTRFTMEGDFYRRGMGEVGIEVIVPDPGEREEIHRIIYQELARGLIREDSRARVIGIAEKLIRKGAQGIILGCTELPLLIPKDSLDVAILNTAEIHALAALEAALGD